MKMICQLKMWYVDVSEGYSGFWLVDKHSFSRFDF